MDIKGLKRQIENNLFKGENVYIYDDSQKEKAHILGNGYCIDIEKVRYYINKIDKNNLIIALYLDNGDKKLSLCVYLKEKLQYNEE